MVNEHVFRVPSLFLFDFLRGSNIADLIFYDNGNTGDSCLAPAPSGRDHQGWRERSLLQNLGTRAPRLTDKQPKRWPHRYLILDYVRVVLDVK